MATTRRTGSESSTVRVVVTGVGPVSSIGIGVDDFAAGLAVGRSGVMPISAFDTTGFAHANGCPVTGFSPSFTRVDPDRIGRAAQFSVAAAGLALADAGVDPTDLAHRPGVVSVGTTDGESQDLDLLTEMAVRDGPDTLPAQVMARVPASWLSVSVAHEYGLRAAEAVTLPTACAAGNYAIGYAYDVLRLGEAEYALCGGADAMCRKTFAGFYRLGTIAPEVCQPFDADRCGILTGEGAGMLFLETLDHARERGARIYAEILGYGMTCDAKHPVAPDQTRIAECIRRAHQNAGVRPADIDLVSAHGTGTKANDLTEAAAIREVFGESAPPTVSIKSMIGHTMGAASALAAIGCALAIDRKFIPPTINHRRTDPLIGLDCVPNRARPADLQIVQNNAFAFGGNNAILVLASPGGPA
ncbi:beta-ketoacyl-[acyl-carrier-protein] synthase family protein [Solwaraspora sp. WMMD1047]|uniref:beta-ketoacyl-[acyl-carrier-protein] synthase family protein n=1 Tax=Solwaraspora sp. WMMD1047 TaxID=3016102 RepID=UPI0024168E11|nr:beta-ketoacyl-[acyl-carrier-protein] synthase family protein [Solwaraspora sp. WMMD1047]MDG4831693.1 beta-ketoacyl-[acyl-carrier-protein] synthase family protein [Solwaraspora sp. WMMD1047]